MRISILVALVLIQVFAFRGQTSLKEINFNSRKYDVGFKNYTAIDNTRIHQKYV